MNPPCNHKPRLGERGKCEALSFSLSHSFPSLSILNRHAEHINTFQQATRKIRQNIFAGSNTKNLTRFITRSNRNYFVNFIEKRTYCLSREFGFQDFDEFLANRSHPKGVLVLKSTFFILFYFSSCPTKLRDGVLEKTTTLFLCLPRSYINVVRSR